MVTDMILGALNAGLNTLLEYLSAHVLTCLIPAFFIAGAISTLPNKETVLKVTSEQMLQNGSATA